MLARTLATGRRGDTIIEVLFATATFSLLAVGSLSIMNMGAAIAQRSLELTLVRQQMDAQAEALRFIHHSYVSTYDADEPDTPQAQEWRNLRNDGDLLAEGGASTFGNNDCNSIPDHAFVMNPKTGRLYTGDPQPVTTEDSPPFAQIVYQDETSPVIEDVYGIWVEAVPSPVNPLRPRDPGFVDFHIRACWFSPGSDVPATLGTIVRLYEPRY